MQHQIDQLTKGLSKLNTSVNASASGGASSSQVNSFSCQNCGGTNHDTSYCGGLSPEHVAAYKTRQDGFRGSGGGVAWRQPPPGFASQPQQWNQQAQPSYNSNPQYQNLIHLHLNTKTQEEATQGITNTTITQVPQRNQEQAPQVELTQTQLLQSMHSQMQTFGQQMQKIRAHNKMVDSQLAQLAERTPFNSPSTLPGQLQSNPSHNSKPNTCKTITLRSGTSYEGPNEGDSEEKKGGEEIVNEDKRGEKEKVDEIDGGSEKKKLDNEKTTSIPSEARNLDGPVSFPGQLAERKLNDKFEKFLSVMKNLHINLPFIEVVTQMSSYSKFLKDILTNKRKLNDELITLPHQVSALVQHKMPKKEKDPGKMIPTRKTIQLVDRSVKLPCGELEDVPIQVGHIYVPCDFVVMDMEEDVNTPLILGFIIANRL
ncbi:uncharacterized protein LOC110712291 [Chenopodium quinoa]|uniref:uncharacterized protein LOC110712291 n=1 Tax=Chenopodium quinoa TaxID=63459 RepID=UPI000B7831A5|nr:uncharacterized protein LOC110712291 [Chenopodium quinoa]